MSRDRSQTGYQADEPPEGTPAERRDDDRTLPYIVPFGWPRVFDRSADDETYPPNSSRADYADGNESADEDDGSWLDGGVITLTILAGVALFLFPEPATSGLGILLIGVGVVAWLIDWAT